MREQFHSGVKQSDIKLLHFDGTIESINDGKDKLNIYGCELDATSLFGSILHSVKLPS